MRKIILGLLLALLLLSSPNLSNAAGVPGVLIIVEGGIQCTGFNVQQTKDTVYAITAAHCFESYEKLPTVLHAQTKQFLGTAKIGFIANDLAVIYYKSEEPVPTLPLTVTLPSFGALIWGCGLHPQESQVLCFPGLWSGDTATFKGGKYPMAFIPIRTGFSGGPLGHSNGVFGMFSMYIMDSMAGITLVAPAIDYLERQK